MTKPSVSIHGSKKALAALAHANEVAGRSKRMTYSEDTIFSGSFDHNAMNVGDQFHMNGTLYTIERKSNDGPFMRFTEAPITVFVVSFFSDQGWPRYQVCIWNGDWEGCTPAANSIEDALIAEIARLEEIYQHDTTIELGDFDIGPQVFVDYRDADGTCTIDLYKDARGFYWTTEALTDDRFSTLGAAIQNAIEFYSA